MLNARMMDKFLERCSNVELCKKMQVMMIRSDVSIV